MGSLKLRESAQAYENTSVLRDAAIRESTYWKLPWRAEKLGADSGRIRVHLLHRRSARHHALPGPCRAPHQDYRDHRVVSSGGYRSKDIEHHRAIGGGRTRRTGVDADLRHPSGL